MLMIARSMVVLIIMSSAAISTTKKDGPVPAPMCPPSDPNCNPLQFIQ